MLIVPKFTKMAEIKIQNTLKALKEFLCPKTKQKTPKTTPNHHYSILDLSPPSPPTLYIESYNSLFPPHYFLPYSL